MKMRMAALALVALLGLGAAACGGDDDSVSQQELERATEEAAEKAREEAENEAKLDELRKELQALRKRQNREQKQDGSSGGGTTTTTTAESSSGDVPEDAKDCGGGVLARADTTSCAFALNVAAKYFSAGGNTEIDVYSPATGQTYRMSCVGGSPIVCTGGDNAAVYILVS